MAIKNFRNRLKEAGPELNGLKDPALADDFSLVDFDDRPKRAPSPPPAPPPQTMPPPPPITPEKRLEAPLEVSAPTPLTLGEILPNLEITQREPRENLEITQRKSRDNLEKTQRKPRENLEIPPLSANLEKTQRESRENLEKTQRKPRDESRDNLETIQRKSRDILEKTQREPRDIPRDESRDNLEIFQRKPRDATTFSSLVGLQRRITLFIYSETVRVRDRTTDAITGVHLAELCKTSLFNVQNAIKELIKKQVLRRAEFKAGRGGWTRYELSQDIFQEIIALEANGKLRDILEITQRKPRDIPRDKPRDEFPSSSSSDLIINKTTTTAESVIPGKVTLPPEWESIDYSALTHIGLGKHHIIQIFEARHVEAETVQRSIDEMAFDLKPGKDHGLRRPLSVFMKQLKVNGQPYTAITPGYESDEVKYERKRLEELKRRQDDLSKLHQEQRAILESADREREEREFQEWRLALSKEDIRRLVPYSTQEGSDMQVSLLKNHWQKAIKTKEIAPD